MAKLKKWEIADVKKRATVCNAAKIILKTRLDHLLKTIEIYFENKDVENLHDVRIALRRVRYNMELFIVCFQRKLFLRFYRKVENLQDQSGFVRDLDVFKENMDALIRNENVRISKTIFNKVDKKRKNLESSLELELMKFKLSKSLKEFYKQIN